MMDFKWQLPFYYDFVLTKTTIFKSKQLHLFLIVISKTFCQDYSVIVLIPNVSITADFRVFLN